MSNTLSGSVEAPVMATDDAIEDLRVAAENFATAVEHARRAGIDVEVSANADTISVNNFKRTDFSFDFYSPDRPERPERPPEYVQKMP